MKQDALIGLKKNGRSIVLIGLAIGATAVIQKACEQQTGDFLLRVHPLEINGRKGFIAKGDKENISKNDTLWLVPKKPIKPIRHLP